MEMTPIFNKLSKLIGNESNKTFTLLFVQPKCAVCRYISKLKKFTTTAHTPHFNKLTTIFQLNKRFHGENYLYLFLLVF